MHTSDAETAPVLNEPATVPTAPPESNEPGGSLQPAAPLAESWRWWAKLIVQPALFLGGGALLLSGLGFAQHLGWLPSAGGSSQTSHVSHGESATRYICPMMCTPPQAEPGRCPVCAMELVPATSGSGPADPHAVRIDPAARRIANIQTVAVTSLPMQRTIRAIGELKYDEGSLKTIAAYVDGRLERLYADYTGVVVQKGDHLALVYSPRLYSTQVELLLARKAQVASQSAGRERTVVSNLNLYESARQRLIELGMTAAQITQLEEAGEANSRMHVSAPISGTVIEKLAVEGQYVKEGEAIYQLADLSAVWLMLRLFPEDAAAIRYGQQIEAEVQSRPGEKLAGRVAFIDPQVDPKTRTVGVRVVIPNENGDLRIGDYARATIEVPLTPRRQTLVYDSELARKWISPRHPHVVQSSPGACPICGIDLVPAAQFGFSDEPLSADHALAVPRSAVLMAGDNSVVYVETEPGRFELRRVTLGPICGDQIVILKGVKQDEQVATRGNFLIDSQMQLAGNPSLIDPTKAQPMPDETLSPKLLAALAKLSPADRALAEKQRRCPVADLALGSMGTPLRINVKGTPVFICCEACRKGLADDPDKYLAKLVQATSPDGSHEGLPEMDLPPLGPPEMIEPDNGVPPPGVPVPVEDDGDSLAPSDAATRNDQSAAEVVR